jgi:hypothetical protein
VQVRGEEKSQSGVGRLVPLNRDFTFGGVYDGERCFSRQSPDMEEYRSSILLASSVASLIVICGQ